MKIWLGILPRHQRWPPAVNRRMCAIEKKNRHAISSRTDGFRAGHGGPVSLTRAERLCCNDPILPKLSRLWEGLVHVLAWLPASIRPLCRAPTRASPAAGPGATEPGSAPDRSAWDALPRSPINQLWNYPTLSLTGSHCFVPTKNLPGFTLTQRKRLRSKYVQRCRQHADARALKQGDQPQATVAILGEGLAISPSAGRI